MSLLIRQLEELAARAWPAAQTEEVAGWQQKNGWLSHDNQPFQS